MSDVYLSAGRAGNISLLYVAHGSDGGVATRVVEPPCLSVALHGLPFDSDKRKGKQGGTIMDRSTFWMTAQTGGKAGREHALACSVRTDATHSECLFITGSVSTWQKARARAVAAAASARVICWRA